MNNADLNLEGFMDLLGKIIQRQFSRDVASIYFGDIGVYPPKSFQDEKGQWKPLVAISADGDREVPGSKSHAEEERILSVDLLVMVNMTPYFEASPQEAMGERMLIRMCQKLRTYFSQSENFTLGGRVTKLEVTDVDFHHQNRKESYVRVGNVQLEATVTQSRLLI